jgi:hypothetical protein
MVQWVNQSSGVADRNGTSSHTISFGFTSTTNNLLVAVIAGGVTHDITGWTQQLAPVNSTELAVFTKTSAGESSLTVTHNASNYPVGWCVFEFPSDAAWDSGTSVANSAGTTFPTLTGLTGGAGNERLLIGGFSEIHINGDTASSATPGTGQTELVDVNPVGTADSEGVFFYLEYEEDVTATSYTPSVASMTDQGRGAEKVTFAIDPGTLSGGTPATVTPSAIARAFTIPAATVAGAAATTPAAVSRSITIPAPSVKGAAATTPAAVVTTVTTPAASVSGGAVAEPAVTARSFTIPQASPGTPGETAPDTIARSISVNAATPSGSAVTEPAAVAQSFTLPQASPATPVTVAPDTTTTTVAVPQATPQGLAATSPAAIESSIMLPAVTVEGVGTVDPATINLALTLPAVTPTGGGEPETVTPTTVSLAYTTPTPTVSGGAVAEPSTLTAVADVEAATVRVDAVVAPDAVARSFNLPAVTIKGAATVVASVINLAVVIGRAVRKIIHSPNPATAPLATSGSGVAPSAGSTLGADLTVTGMSTANPNTGKSSATDGTSGSEAE